MSEEKNVFTNVDSVIEMVREACEDVPTETIERVYCKMWSAIDEKRKEDFWRDKFINEWHIELKKNPSRFRPIEDVILDIAKLWSESGGRVRDDIYRMFLGVSSDCNELYQILDSYRCELYQVEIFPDEQDSIYASVDAMKKALDQVFKNKPKFSPSLWMLKAVYKYVAYGYNAALRNKESEEEWLLYLGIHIRGGFCKMFEDLVACYGKGDFYLKRSLDNHFYRGSSERSLIFTNVMDRLWHDYYKMPYFPESKT